MKLYLQKGSRWCSWTTDTAWACRGVRRPQEVCLQVPALGSYSSVTLRFSCPSVPPSKQWLIANKLLHREKKSPVRYTWLFNVTTAGLDRGEGNFPSTIFHLPCSPIMISVESNLFPLSSFPPVTKKIWKCFNEYRQKVLFRAFPHTFSLWQLRNIEHPWFLLLTFISARSSFFPSAE